MSLRRDIILDPAAVTADPPAAGLWDRAIYAAQGDTLRLIADLRYAEGDDPPEGASLVLTAWELVETPGLPGEEDVYEWARLLDADGDPVTLTVSAGPAESHRLDLARRDVGVWFTVTTAAPAPAPVELRLRVR